MKASLKKLLTLIIGQHGVIHLIFFLKHPIYYWRLGGHVNIDGWLGYSEAVYLYKKARDLKKNKSPRIVEIGVWQGKSAVVMGLALKGSNGKITGIDVFNTDGDVQSQPMYKGRLRELKISLKEACANNLCKNGVESIVQLIQGYSYDVVRTWNEPIDLLFIDGNHEYGAVKQDFLEWTPFLVPGGTLILDDVFFEGEGHPGPAKVVEEMVIGSVEWEDGQSVGDLYSVSKIAHSRHQKS